MFKYKIIANWKMNASSQLCKKFLDYSERAERSLQDANKEVIVCPPATHIHYLASGLSSKSNIEVGAQNCSTIEGGAYTGEIGCPMLKELGCKYVLVGHSERRIFSYETDEDVRRKIAIVQKSGLVPIVCIGEPYDVHRKHNTLGYLKAQLEAAIGTNAKMHQNPELREKKKNTEGVLSLSQEDVDTKVIIANQSNILVAYEPLWAIGSGIIPDKNTIQSVVSYLIEHFPQIRMLYGGSVSTETIATIRKVKNLSGILVGGASLDLAVFEQIVQMV